MKRKLALTMGVALLGGAALTGFAPAAGAAPATTSDAQARGAVWLYQLPNYRGGKAKFTRSDENLANNKYDNRVTVNNRVRSVKNKSNRTLRLYDKPHFTGPVYTIKAGKQSPRLPAIGDGVSAIHF